MWASFWSREFPRSRSDDVPLQLLTTPGPHSLKKLLGHHLPVADNDAGIDSDEELEATAGGDVGGGGAGKRKYGVLGNWDAVGWMAVKRVRRVIGGEFM